jgi:hypothetical protein
MLFTIKHQSQEEARLSKQAQSLYDLSIELGGSFYLTYRNFAQPGQVLAAYPELPKFMEAKMKWDPEEIFYSGFYQYLKSAR